jgi:hypothetical protein
MRQDFEVYFLGKADFTGWHKKTSDFATLGRTVFVRSNEIPDVVVDSLEAGVLACGVAQCWL